MVDAILSLDIGTTVVKAVLFDLAGQELAVAEQALGLHRPRPGWAELDPEEMWQAVAAVARAAGADPDRRAQVRAVGLATQGGSNQTRHVDGLSDALRFGYDEKPRLVHRLDKDTSGVLLLARTRAVAKALTDAFRSRETRM